LKPKEKFRPETVMEFRAPPERGPIEAGRGPIEAKPPPAFRAPPGRGPIEAMPP